MKAVEYETITLIGGQLDQTVIEAVNDGSNFLLIGDFRRERNEIHVYIRRAGTSFFDSYGKRGMN